MWPSYVIALNNLATVSDNETDIETFLLKALHLDPGHTTALFNLADLYRYTLTTILLFLLHSSLSQATAQMCRVPVLLLTLHFLQ